MKIDITRCMGFCLLITLALPGRIQAQFFKDILNTAKQTAQSRANSKTAQTTNKALDKVDPATATKSNTSSSGNNNNSSGNNSSAGQTPLDTSETNGVLAAFAKAAAENPNDTSSADLTMKALGLLTGGGGVSAQDSVAAINSFRTASGGPGIHYEYRIVTSGNKISTITDTSQIYFTNNGEGRGEMSIPMPGMKMNKMISIGRAREPKYTLLLYTDSKTYSLNIIDTNLMKSQGTYQVAKVGSETVQGYSCIHSKLTTTNGSGMFKSTSTTDIWTSTSVPGYSVFKTMTDLRTSQTGMLNALEKAGCGGIMVKMSISGKDASMEEDLIRAEKSNCSAELFKIPSGYSESTGNMFSHMMEPAKK